MTIHLTLPTVQCAPATRPDGCPTCGHWHLQRHGRIRKPIRDQQFSRVLVDRYRCVHCRHTFRHYPQGVTSADYSQRLVAFLAIIWALGLSLRRTALVLSLRLSERWQSYRLAADRADVPRTNNRAEQAIGRLKVRSRTVRGYKSVAGLLHGCALAGVVGTGQTLDLTLPLTTP